MAQDGTLEPWIARRLTPKILLATQTKTLEVYADAAGRYVPSTPLITVAPHRPDRIWHVAAALASPVCTAIGLRDYWGAALSATALKLSARQALALPLPADRSAWDRAAAAFEAAQRAGRARERRAGLLSMAEASVDAYRVPGPARDTLLDWWRDRLWSGRELVDPSRDA